MIVQLTEAYYLLNCTNCGIPFAVPEAFDQDRRRDKRTFHCPNGHPQVYALSEADRVRALLETKTKEAERLALRLNNSEAELTIERKAKERLAKRLKAGVCPVAGCKRHFSNLERHVATEHAGVALLLDAKPVKQIEGKKP